MLRFIAILFLFICSSILGQAKIINIPVNQNGDTSFWYTLYKERASKIGLPQLDTISSKSYFRIWTNRQCINVWQNQNGVFTGELTTWTDEHEAMYDPSANRTFVLHKKLSADTTELLRRLFVSSKALKLPTDDSIKGWGFGDDGITYVIECLTEDNYSFKTYWTPEIQKSLEEAKQVQEFVDSAFTLANAERVWNAFVPTIPYRCFINGGPMVTCKPYTEKEFRRLIWNTKSMSWFKRLKEEVSLSIH